MLHYNDLQTDLEGEMRRLAARLGITVPEDRWPALVEAATFENMRAHADEIAPDTTHAIWTDNKRFFNRGRSGQWRDILDDAALERYDRARRDAGVTGRRQVGPRRRSGITDPDKGADR